MANSKKRKTEAECKSQFARTVKKTGKWRGMTPEAYFKKFGERGFRSGRSIIECNHHFSDGECIHCHVPAKSYYAQHPKKLAILMKTYGVKTKKATV